MRKNEVFKLLSFLIIGIIVLVVICNILKNPLATDSANGTGLVEVHSFSNQYDVIILGNSSAVYNIYNQELYEQYGIASISLGEPQQPAFLSYYTLSDALLNQCPTVVIYDTSNLFYDEDRIKSILNSNDEAYLHFSIDGMKNLKNKFEALNEAQKYINFDKWDYLSKLYYSHNNWKKLDRFNFLGYDKEKNINGNTPFYGISENRYDIYTASNSETIANISNENKEVFERIVNLCRQKKIQLIVTTDYVHFTKDMANSINDLCIQYNVPYININEHINEIGFNYKTDLHDEIHFNLNGAIKWTNFIGKYLTENYEFTDRRGDDRYFRYEKQKTIFANQREIMDTKIKLLSAVTFDEYLSVLQGLDYSKNSVFISAYDDATQALSEEEFELLEALGLKTDLRGQFKSSYVAVISNNGVTEEFSVDDVVVIEDSVDNISYLVKSGGYNSGHQATITINGKEQMQKGRGLNIVVYNKEPGQILSSVYFDTCEATNSPARRFSNTSTKIDQLEVDVNVWENQ